MYGTWIVDGIQYTLETIFRYVVPSSPAIQLA